MAIDLDEQDGQTPLDADELAGLVPTHLVTKGDLNDWVHSFPNGNGRHSRMMADALLRGLKQEPFSWGGGGTLVKADSARSDYLTALRAADQGDYTLLLVFVRSTATPEKK
jgi:fido (protein-threonine AMPylation protein)